MNADQFIVTACVVLMVATLAVMRYASTHVYLKYNKTGNACPSKKSITR